MNNDIGKLENTILSNSSKIDKNKNDISSNLGIINTNRNNISSNDTDIAYNLREINNIKNSIYLKNIYSILFYDSKHKSILKVYFFKKYLMLMLIKMIL